MELLIRDVGTFDSVIRAVCVDRRAKTAFIIKSNTIELLNSSNSVELQVKANLYIEGQQKETYVEPSETLEETEQSNTELPPRRSLFEVMEAVEPEHLESFFFVESGELLEASTMLQKIHAHTMRKEPIPVEFKMSLPAAQDEVLMFHIRAHQLTINGQENSYKATITIRLLQETEKPMAVRFNYEDTPFHNVFNELYFMSMLENVLTVTEKEHITLHFYKKNGSEFEILYENENGFQTRCEATNTMVDKMAWLIEEIKFTERKVCYSCKAMSQFSQSLERIAAEKFMLAIDDDGRLMAKANVPLQDEYIGSVQLIIAPLIIGQISEEENMCESLSYNDI